MTVLFNAAVSGTVTAALILLIKAAFRNKISAELNFALWLVLFIRLMVPILPESPISFQNALPVAQDVSVRSAESTQIPENNLPGFAVEDGDFSAPAESEQTAAEDNGGEVNRRITIGSAENSFSVASAIENTVVTVWAVGAVAFAAFFAVSYMLFCRKVRAVSTCADEKTLALFEDCKKIVGVKGDVRVSVVKNIRPMLKGWFRPAVLIPGGYGHEELRYVFAHELCHYKHRDNFFTLTALLVVCLNWYNPVLWYCLKVLRQDTEILCDKNVVKTMGGKKAYAQVLVKEAWSDNRLYPFAAPMTNGKGEIVKRINFMSAFRKTKSVALVGFLLCVVLLCAGCLTNAVTSLPRVENCRWVVVPEIPAEDIRPSIDDLAFGALLAYTGERDYNRLSFITRDGKNGAVDYSGEIVIPCEEDVYMWPEGIVSQRESIYDEYGKNCGETGGHGVCSLEYNLNENAVCNYEEMFDADFFSYYGDEVAEIFEYYIPDREVWAMPAIKAVLSTTAENAAESVEYTDKFVYVCKDGKLLTETQFEKARQFSDDLAAAQQNGKWGFIDLSGNTVIPFYYDYAYSFNGGITAVCVNGQWGFIDQSGAALVPFQFEKASQPYFDGVSSKAWVKTNGQWGVIEIIKK